ncbi:MAG TPA: hypothetical protein VKE51_15215 [Vicinamibacterales bacterium]|nr:hypothetical protein [Vicinamibacterales bacterium]
MTTQGLSEPERAAVRAKVFTHLAGVVMAPTVSALSERGALDVLMAGAGPVAFADLVERTHANAGYLRVALRLLASCGWLVEESGGNDARTYALTPDGHAALTLARPLHTQVTSSFLPKALILDDVLAGPSDESFIASVGDLVTLARNGWGIASSPDPAAARIHDRIRGHLEGLFAAPAMVALARGGIFARLAEGPLDLRSTAAGATSVGCLLDLLSTTGWVERTGSVVQLTGCGRYAAQIASAYGVTVSYLPMFAVLPTLLFGNARIPRVDSSGVETMVNRAMNVWGSGGAHTTYFKRLDEIVVDIFNRPVSEQPRGICDMGCGDGTLLAHLYSVIRDRTARGRELDSHPLVIVGADFNRVARRATRHTLHAARIPGFHVITGDINRPAQLASDLEAIDLDIHDLMHIRSFLDHNRPYVRLSNYVSGSRHASTSGGFAYLGEEIPADELEENLVRHLRRWRPYVGRFGLLVLELHTLPPALTAANLERTPAVAYDATHGFSDQYLVELPVFDACAREAGLRAEPRWQAKFPPSELATVSLNYFTAA